MELGVSHAARLSFPLLGNNAATEALRLCFGIYSMHEDVLSVRVLV